MNLLYLLKILDTNKISELVGNIDLPPIDINLIIWDAIDNSDVKVDEKKDKIVPLKEPEPSCDEILASKLMAVIQHYSGKEINVTRGTLNAVIKDPATGKGYPWHEYLMALQYLVDTGKVVEGTISVPEVKALKRPYHKFVFLGLPGNPNEEWNAREINKWLDKFSNKKVR